MRDHDADAGFTLIETVVALLVFAILSTGLVAGTGATVRLIADSRARVVATALAAQDISLARAVADPFALAGASGAQVTSSTQQVGTRTYTVQRTVHLVSRTGEDVACNTSTDLFYARVNVRVTWTGQAATTAAVQDDTVVASNGAINDAATGSVSVNVYGADGTPRSGVAVTIATLSGGAALATQPAATDANGCSRVGGVTPGTYTVKLSRSGYVDINQVEEPTSTVIVTAGTNQALSAQYDRSATFALSYIGYPQAYTGAVLPTNLDLTFLNSTSGPYMPAVTTTPPSSIALHPFTTGYSAVAGSPSDATGATVCAANDPNSWSAGTLSTVRVGAGQRATAAAVPGGSASFAVAGRTGVPMGVVVANAGKDRIIQATTATPPVGTGNPGCTTTRTYTFAMSTATSTALLLPYGSYTITTGTSATGTRTKLTSSQLSVPSNAIAGLGVASDGTVTLDPRPLS